MGYQLTLKVVNGSMYRDFLVRERLYRFLRNEAADSEVVKVLETVVPVLVVLLELSCAVLTNPLFQDVLTAGVEIRVFWAFLLNIQAL